MSATRLLDLPHAGQGAGTRAARRGRAARARPARRPALLPRRRVEPARQQQGNARPAAAGPRRLRRGRGTADAALPRRDDGRRRDRGGDELTTNFHRRPRAARRVAGPWDEALSETVGEPLGSSRPDVGADRGRGGAATLLGEASLGAIAGELGVDRIDGRRFRMNFGIDGIEAHDEDGWIGRRVQVGEAVVVPQGNVGRCAITTQNPDTGQVDLDTLKALAALPGRGRDDRAAAVRHPRRRRRARPRPPRRPGPPPLAPAEDPPFGGLRRGPTGVYRWGEVGYSGATVDHAARRT